MDRLPRLVLLLSFVAMGFAVPKSAHAFCSVIPPSGTAQRAFLGSVRSPFLFPGLTNDIKVNALECDHAEDSVAPDFIVNGNEVADDFVITIAFVPADAPATLLVLSDDATLCGADSACVVDTTLDREIVEVPLPTGVERVLRFRFPDVPPSVGPVRLGVRLKAGSAPPVASELRNVKCLDATQGTYAACIDEFYDKDGSCRVGDEFVAEPFSGLVAVPRTNFTDICTEGCGGLPPALTSLPVTTDREGNMLSAILYTDWLIKVDRGDGQIEPRPRRFDLAVANATSNGFPDAVYEGLPSSFTAEGYRVSPPFQPAKDPNASADQVAFWAMNDGDGGVHLIPRQSCSDDPLRACQASSDCSAGAVCGAVEFTFSQDGQPVQLPLARASVGEAVELNSWLDGKLTDAAVAVVIDEVLGGVPLNHDGAADDSAVIHLLDRGSGLYKQLRGLFRGRGLAQVRVAEAGRDFVEPSVAVEGDRFAFLESEYAEGLAHPMDLTTAAEANAADDNQNARLDYNLRAFALDTDDPAEPNAISLLTGAHVAVLPELRFGGRNIVLSDGHLFFAYSPSKQGPHAYQRVDQASDGSLGNFFAGNADLSPDGRFLAFVSGADNLFTPAPPGPTFITTSGGTTVESLTTSGEIPDIINGQSVFEFEAIDNGKGAKPSKFYVEIRVCAAGQPDLVALFDEEASGPNVQLKATATSCDACNFPGSMLAEFDRGLGGGQSQIYRLVFNSPSIPPAEVGISMKAGGKAEVSTIRGPGCVDPTVQGGIARVYLRDVVTGETQLASGLDRNSCSDQGTAVDIASGNPDVVVAAGESVFFDSDARLASDDTDDTSDIYRYDATTCSVTNLSGGFAGAAADPTSSGDGTLVAFELGTPSDIVLVDLSDDSSTNFGPGFDPALSADGTKLVFAADVGGVSQVFLVDLLQASPVAVAMSVEDGLGGAFLLSGGGSPDVADAGRTAFETPSGDPDAEILARDLVTGRNRFASSVALGVPLCTSSPCGAFSPSISRDGRFVSYTVRGLGAVDEIMIADLLTGSLTPVTRMAGADAHSSDAQLGNHADFLVFSSHTTVPLGNAPGGGTPGIFLDGPVDLSAKVEARLGVLDLGSCDGTSVCEPDLTDVKVEAGAVYQGDVAVVGSPVHVVDVGANGNLSVTSFGREGSAVALSAQYVCAITDPNDFAACGARASGSLNDLTFGGASIPSSAIGLCGTRAVTLGSDGILYVADLSSGSGTTAVQFAEDFEMGEDLDIDGDEVADTCLVAFRTLEQDLQGLPGEVGNGDADKNDKAMYVHGADGVTTDCVSSTVDCPGQACRKFNYQVGKESVLFVVDETHENFGLADACAVGTDINLDGLCGQTVRRCSAAGALTEGSAFGQGVNLFSDNNFQDDGENVVTQGGFCGASPSTVRIPQFCTSNLDCLDQPGETCQTGIVLVAAADQDGDEIPDVADNCPVDANPGQEDEDMDGFGDACDTFSCGNGIVQEAESCDEGAMNGMPGSSCSLECTCQVNFAVLETLKPTAKGNTPFVIFGSAAADGSGCLNLDKSAVGGTPAKGIDPATIRLSATQPTMDCPDTGGAPTHSLTKNGRYNAHLEDLNLDGILDLRVHADTPGIGADSSTTMVYLTGRLEGQCFESVSPIDVAGGK